MFEDGTATHSEAPVNPGFTSVVGNKPTAADANTVSLTCSNTSYPTAIRKSPYTIKNIVVRYTKIDNANFVLSENINSQPTMLSGGSVVIPITIATAPVKDSLLDNGFVVGTSWNFYVNVSFTIYEDLSGKSNPFTNVPLGTVQFN